MSEWWPFYVDKNWREGCTLPTGQVLAANAPHVPYTCNFEFQTTGSNDPRLNGRNMEYLQNAMTSQINAWRDLIVTLTRRADV
jgi:hypothetical protein